MFLENEKIKLRALEPEDLDNFYKWENDVDLWSLGCTLKPYSRYELKQYILSQKDIFEAKQLRLIIENKVDNNAIGTIDLYDFDPHNRRAAVGIMIDRAYQGNGLAVEALTLLCEYTFSFLKLHQLFAYIPIKNERSVRLFANCGFKDIGLLPEWIQATDGFEDVRLVSLISGR